VTDALRERGVDVRTGAKASRVRRNGAVEVELDGGDTVAGEEIIVAVGRRPRVGELGLETVGIDADGYLDVDDTMRVAGRDWLYAIGDVNGRALLTHMGKYQARIVADQLLGKDVAASAEALGSPRVTFTDPQVAAVGLTAAAADERGIAVRAVDVETAANAGASFHGRNAPGTSRLVVDTDRDVIVGATFVGPETAELLHAATVAIVAELPLARLAHAVPTFPTRNEIWLGLLEEYGV
jgi:dihydrolipoamide dehydrogenase